MVQPSFQTGEGSPARSAGRRGQQRNGTDDRGHQHTHRLHKPPCLSRIGTVPDRLPCRREIGLFTGLCQGPKGRSHAKWRRARCFRNAVIFLLYQYLDDGLRAGQRSSLAVATGGYSPARRSGRWSLRGTSRHGREALRRTDHAPRRPGAADRAGPVRRRREPARHAARGLRAQPACAMPASAASTARRPAPCPASTRCSPPTTCPPRIATGQIPMLVPNPAIRTPRTQIALARDEVCYVGQTVAVVVADSRASRRGRRRGRRDRLRAAAGGERCPRRGEARRGARARRSRLERRGLRADELRRRRGRVQERAACVRGGDACCIAARR